MRLYKKVVKIKGYGNFDKICNINTKGAFTIHYPVKVITDDIIETDYVYATSLKEAEQEWSEKVSIFESLSYDYNTVILYTIDEKASGGDGSGYGFMIQWGVFREIKGKTHMSEYFFERTYKGRPITRAYNKLHKWNKINWSPEREDFFTGISVAIETLHSNLSTFLNFSNMQDEDIDDAIKNGRLKLLK